MTNKLSLTFILAPLLLVIWLAGCPPADACAEWELVSGAEQMGNVFTVKSDGRRIYAGAELGVFVSLDDGNTWRSTELTHTVYEMAVSSDEVYASTLVYHGLYRSNNHGNTWKPINNGLDTHITDKGVHRYPSIDEIHLTTSGTVIAVGYHSGTFTSNDQGETWHDVFDEWAVGNYKFGREIRSMTEFDGYLWAAAGLSSSLFRSPDNGDTWDDVHGLHGAILEYGTVDDWTVLDDLLYVGGDEGIGRWNEAELTWDNLSEGLPLHIYKEGYHPAYREYLRDDYPVTNLAVNRGRIFAAVFYHGVYLFDERSETWIPAGLDGLNVYDLISHQSDLYAATKEGIYRASIPSVLPYGKAATTWGAVKTK